MTKGSNVESIRVMALGDVVGRVGRRALQSEVQTLRAKHQVDLLIANGENASGGAGLSPESAQELMDAGVDVITLGDHTWQRRGIADYLNRNQSTCIRPANYPAGAAGRGWTIWKYKSESGSSFSIGIMNLMGRVFINGALDCPFRMADKLLKDALKDCQVVICDMHAEATSEKIGMGRHLDGRASLVFGTHTHVQTADNQVFPGGTGFICDIGMCGPINSVLGLKTEISLKRFLTGIFHPYDAAKGPAMINGVLAELDCASGKAISVDRVYHRCG